MAHLRRRVKERDYMEMVVFEQRLLIGVTAGVLFTMILWIVAVSTDSWIHVTAPTGAIYVNRTNSYFIKSNSGLWRMCRTEGKNGSLDEKNIVTWCRNHRMFPTSEQIEQNPDVDRTILDYTRTEAAFSIISFCLMTMGLGFSAYTFKEPRYMFKRLAGGIHFLTAAAILVVIEVLANSVNYEAQMLTSRHPKGAQWSFGYSFIVAWLTLILFVIAGIIFLICSRKKKGDRAPSDYRARADEPHILGRM